MNPSVIIDAFLPVSLAVIMFSMGLTLTVGDFRRVVMEPRAVAIGLACQMVLLPLIAAGLVTALAVPPAVAVGIMILAACPGGITSNLLTHLARGDTALSISLTAVTSIAGVVTVPLIVNGALMAFGGADAPVDLPVGRMVTGVFVITTLPVLLGMGLRAWRPALTARLEPKARGLSTALFAVIVGGAFASQWDDMARLFKVAGPAALALNVATMASGWLGARLGRLDGPRQTAITLECGLQNAALAIFVAATLLGRPDMIAPAMIYALIMNITAAAVIALAVGRALGHRAPFRYR